MQTKNPAVYMLANKKNGTLYVGVTADLPRRMQEHKNNLNAGFSHRYNCTLLVFYQFFVDMSSAIEAEKKIKKFSRAKKIALIEHGNPEWADLDVLDFCENL